MSRFDVRREAKLREIRNIGPFVAASLCKVSRRCGNPNCKCAKGQPHYAHCLTFKVAGKTRSVHVPKDMVEEVQKWVKEHRRLKDLIQAVSRNSLALVHRYVPQKRVAARTKGLRGRS